jgi:hypothetical protein
MTPLETLKAARALISDLARWTQGELARNTDGEGVCPTDNLATCYCSFGAIQFFTKQEFMTEADHHLENVCERLFGTDVINFNDTHPHAEVIALFDAAIAELEGEG